MLTSLAQPVEKIFVKFIFSNRFRNPFDQNIKRRERFDKVRIDNCVKQMRPHRNNFRYGCKPF